MDLSNSCRITKLYFIKNVSRKHETMQKKKNYKILYMSRIFKNVIIFTENKCYIVYLFIYAHLFSPR